MVSNIFAPPYLTHRRESSGIEHASEIFSTALDEIMIRAVDRFTKEAHGYFCLNRIGLSAFETWKAWRMNS
jgi:hypothetical protein